MDDISIDFLIFTFVVGVLFFIVIIQFIKSICLVPTKKAYVVERLGKYLTTLGPGFHALLPFLDKVAFIRDLKEETIDVPPQECFTKDEVKVEVDGVIYISIIDPVKASYGITDYKFAATQLAQTTTRSVIGTLELDRTFEERDVISSKVVNVLEKVGEGWGISVHRYEIKNITPPATVRDAMEKQVTAERDRRAIIAQSEGEKQSRINMSEGKKTEMVNRSEGEKQKKINEAEGLAEEILTVANATATSIQKIAAVMAEAGGKEAIQMQLSQRYIDKMAFLAKEDTKIVLPADLSNPDSLLKRFKLS